MKFTDMDVSDMLVVHLFCLSSIHVLDFFFLCGHGMIHVFQFICILNTKILIMMFSLTCDWIREVII